MGPVAQTIGEGIQDQMALHIGDGVAYQDAPERLNGLIDGGRWREAWVRSRKSLLFRHVLGAEHDSYLFEERVRMYAHLMVRKLLTAKQSPS